MNFLKRLKKPLEKAILHVWLWTLRSLFLRSKKYFYKGHYNSCNQVYQLLKTPIQPKHLFDDFKYGLILPSVKIWKSSKPAPDLEFVDDSLEVSRKLVEDGFAIIPPERYLPIANEIVTHYNINKDSYSPKPGFDITRHKVFPDKVMSYIKDDFLLTTIAQSMGFHPYLRYIPSVNVVYPKIDYELPPSLQHQKGSELIYEGWHHDFRQFNAYLILSDICKNDTHTLYAKGSHKSYKAKALLDDDYYFSEEYIRDHFEVAHLCGKKGSLVLFNTNGLHRIAPVNHSFRSCFVLTFTQGNLMNATRERRFPFDKKTELSLSAFQKEVFKFLRP